MIDKANPGALHAAYAGLPGAGSAGDAGGDLGDARRRAGLPAASADRAACPNPPALYPEGQVTDLYEREIAADLIREAALNLLYDEVPHGIAVRIDQYIERGDARGVHRGHALRRARSRTRASSSGRAGQCSSRSAAGRGSRSKR